MTIIKFPTDRVRASGVPGGFEPAVGEVVDFEEEKAYKFAAHCEEFIKEFGVVPYSVLLGDLAPEEKHKVH